MSFKSVLQTARTATLIGSRKPPERIARVAVQIGRVLSERGIIGYSGGAPGMDSQFMFDYSPDRRVIILPEDGFNNLYANGKDIVDFTQLDTYKAADIARTVAGHFDSQNEYTQRRYSRNTYQVLREDLDSPTDFVLFWAEEVNRSVKGGTAIAVRIARKYNVPVFNLWNESVLNEVCETLGIDIKPRTLDMFL